MTNEAEAAGHLLSKDSARPQDHWTVQSLLNALAGLTDAGNRLCFAAESSGGTAGRDDTLVEAIDYWAAEREKFRQVARIVKLEGHDPEVGAGRLDHPLRLQPESPQ